MRRNTFVISTACILALLVGAAVVGQVKRKSAAEARQRQAEATAKSAAKEAAEQARLVEAAEKERLAAAEAARAEAKRQEAEAIRTFAAQDQAAMESMKRQVSGLLKDPGSAQFTNVRLARGGTVLCGQVNSKNSYGGYGGAKEFVVINGEAFLREGSMELAYAVARANSGC